MPHNPSSEHQQTEKTKVVPAPAKVTASEVMPTRQEIDQAKPIASVQRETLE
ncbi:hypothetical protein [Aneurinibacillus tyrosinisolvens]|uniref:hypothetical protein n=1 Tax=Aneurinibacillus tyrosinisolvens TaxID=1443435 RepID=UPI000B00CE53|nr:hypothetical protein [Aneurinibacillus tyrosinisolvens]